MFDWSFVTGFMFLEGIAPVIDILADAGTFFEVKVAELDCGDSGIEVVVVKGNESDGDTDYAGEEAVC